MSKVTISGKVTARTTIPTKDGSQKYAIELLTVSQYPDTFRILIKDPTMFGTEDGIAAVGKMVTVTAFVNGKKSTSYKNKEGLMVALKFPRYDVWFVATAIEPMNGIEVAPPTPEQVNAATPIDDFPY